MALREVDAQWVELTLEHEVAIVTFQRGGSRGAADGLAQVFQSLRRGVELLLQSLAGLCRGIELLLLALGQGGELRERLL